MVSLDGLLGLSMAGQQRSGRMGWVEGGVGVGAIGLVMTGSSLLSSAKHVNTQSMSKYLLSPNELCHAVFEVPWGSPWKATKPWVAAP